MGLFDTKISALEYAAHALRADVYFRIQSQVPRLEEISLKYADTFHHLARLAYYVNDGQLLIDELLGMSKVGALQEYHLLTEKPRNGAEEFIQRYHTYATWFDIINQYTDGGPIEFLDYVTKQKCVEHSDHIQRNVWGMLTEAFTFPSKRQIAEASQNSHAPNEFVPIALDIWKSNGYSGNILNAKSG